MAFSLSTVTPDTGLSTAGGTTLAAVGTGFTTVTDVTIDGISVSFSIVDDSNITIVTDAHAAGTVQLFVIDPDGTGGWEVTFGDSPTGSECLTLSVGAFLADGATPDGDGIVYTVEQLDGWFETPPIRSATQEVQPLGEFPTVNRENGRQIDLTILAHVLGGAPLGNVGCFQGKETVKLAFQAVFTPVSMTVTDPNGNATTALVQLRSPTRTALVGQAVAARITLALIAPNPTFT